MRQEMRTMIAFGALYALLATCALVPLFGAGGLTDLTFGIALVVVIALFPATAIVLTLFAPLFLVPQRRMPAKPHPAVARAAAAPTTPRDRFELAFAAWNGIESEEAVIRLSRRLHALDIAHRLTDGVVDVHDDTVRWQVAPVHGALRIAGWVEAPEQETRAMIIAAVEEFLIEELGIRIEQRAA